MSSSRLYSPPLPAPPSSPPAAVTVPACKLLAGNKRLRSGRVGASPPPSRRAARSPAAHWKCWAGGRLSSPFPRHTAPPGQPPWKPGSAKRSPREEGGGGARAGAGKRSNRSGEGGGRGEDWRPRQRRRGFCGVSGEGAPAPAARIKPAPPTPRAPGKATPPRRREEGSGTARVSAARRKSPDKGKPRPPPTGPAPCRPRGVPTRPARSPAQGRVNPEGLPPPPPASRFCLARATWGPICQKGRAGCSGRLPRSAAKGCRSPPNVTFSAPL